MTRLARILMPNGFAYLMLLAWPFVAQVLFRILPLHKALIWTILGGYLVLPSSTGIKLPMIPALDKNSIPAISAFVMCWLSSSRTVTTSEGRQSSSRLKILVTTLLVLLLIGPFLTVMTNTEPLFYGPYRIPGLRLYDAGSLLSGAVIAVLPFLLARRYLNNIEGHKEILRAFALGGLAYSLPAMIEVRLSPQLHTWIYGFFPHDFAQHIRAGGFRPTVFLNHGLMVGIFFCLSILAALILWRESKREGHSEIRWLWLAIWLMLTLVMAKSIGALGIAVVLSLVAGVMGRRIQILVAVFVAVFVLFYPMLRGAGLVPVDSVYEFALAYSEDRASSLKFRLDNEDLLLAWANEKPLLGWGVWGRNQVYDTNTGELLSVTDGIWIILIGTFGWIGYASYFGLFTLPIIWFARYANRFGTSLLTPGLLIMISAILIDFLPNAWLVPYVWLMAGAMSGSVENWSGYSIKNGIIPAKESGQPAQPSLQPILG